MDDEGCRFKVKMRPFRIDGFQGEIQTSGISEVVGHTDVASALLQPVASQVHIEDVALEVNGSHM